VLVFIAAASAQAAEPVRVGLTLGLTGKYAALCAMQQRAYELWRRDVNAKGGLLGRPIELIVIDDESVPAKAAEHYRRLITSDRVDLVFSPYSSPITLAVAPIVEKAGYPMVIAGAASEKVWRQGYTSMFGLFSSASRYTLGMLNLALLEDLTTVAIVFADDVFSIGAAEGARKWGSKLGLNVVMFEKFKKGSHDLTYLAKKARLSNPALVITIGHFDESVDMRRALKKVDWYPKAYFATIGPVLPKYREMLGADAELTFVNANWEPRVNFSGSRTFLAKFRALFEIEPSYQAAMAYAAGQIMEAAVKSAGSLERAKIIRALSELETYSIVGRYKVDRTGVQIKHLPLTMQWQNGKKEIVWPEEMQSAKPILK
jgi:branched-chain amino acid transport system substrate-binding protein